MGTQFKTPVTIYIVHHLAALRQKLGRQASSIGRIVYPGYGLTTAEIEELRPVVEAFHKDAELVSFQEVWQ